MIDTTTISALTEFPQRLQAHFAAIPPEFRNWTPPTWDGIPSEPFTAIEQVCHVRDIEVDGYHARFDRTLNEECPDLPDIDGAALARERAYANTDSGDAFAAFSTARAQTMAMIAAWTDDELERPALFEKRPASLRGLVHQLCSHDQQHLAGMQWLLAQIAAQRAPDRR